VLLFCAVEGPLLTPTPPGWADLAAARLPALLGDHAICEQQAAQSALALVGQYPRDEELVERMGALAAEEVGHFRKVVAILHRRGWRLPERRPNPWVRSLRARITSDGEPALECDRLLVAALVEARSAERFTLLGERLADDAEVAALLAELGPAESRHWRLFHDLAARLEPAEALAARWRRWLEIEAEISRDYGREARVHG